MSRESGVREGVRPQLVGPRVEWRLIGGLKLLMVT
jgi:hypothetical protein